MHAHSMFLHSDLLLIYKQDDRNREQTDCSWTIAKMAEIGKKLIRLPQFT